MLKFNILIISTIIFSIGFGCKPRQYNEASETKWLSAEQEEERKKLTKGVIAYLDGDSAVIKYCKAGASSESEKQNCKNDQNIAAKITIPKQDFYTWYEGMAGTVEENEIKNRIGYKFWKPEPERLFKNLRTWNANHPQYEFKIVDGPKQELYNILTYAWGGRKILNTRVGLKYALAVIEDLKRRGPGILSQLEKTLGARDKTYQEFADIMADLKVTEAQFNSIEKHLVDTENSVVNTKKTLAEFKNKKIISLFEIDQIVNSIYSNHSLSLFLTQFDEFHTRKFDERAMYGFGVKNLTPVKGDLPYTDVDFLKDLYPGYSREAGTDPLVFFRSPAGKLFVVEENYRQVTLTELELTPKFKRVRVVAKFANKQTCNFGMEDKYIYRLCNGKPSFVDRINTSTGVTSTFYFPKNITQMGYDGIVVSGNYILMRGTFASLPLAFAIDGSYLRAKSIRVSAPRSFFYWNTVDYTNRRVCTKLDGSNNLNHLVVGCTPFSRLPEWDFMNK